MSSETKEKLEKPKVNLPTKHIPKDAQVVMSILKELNIQDYEPRVINQLLEFVYRYVTCILDDAKAYANHARKKTIDMDDVKLATDVVLDKAFTCPPPRHVLSKLAEARNAMPLPTIKSHCGLRLPPDRYCLSACNYKLRSAVIPKKMVKAVVESRPPPKTQVKAAGQNNNATKRATVVPTPAQLAIPKPVIKFSTTPTNPKPAVDSGPVKMEVDMDTSASTSHMVTNQMVTSIKRSREDEGFEMVP